MKVNHSCWDPKDGELCSNRVKPEETSVEARSGSDVQIDRRIWAGVEVCDEAFGVNSGRTASSADLGGSSKYSNENFED
ncbi:hypothetical protein DASC09_030210 [Saccharomycopsis crataegensis]|uniref:Uncharacterized protein n=1 Tax=Saccharomycopsis crataegensis TaxID=43959 RepID=A0AAV5QLX0_9ASCO|nr:hypothetical protein DASC09_030210 [Saccharomycopsis crataegensis]